MCLGRRTHWVAAGQHGIFFAVTHAPVGTLTSTPCTARRGVCATCIVNLRIYSWHVSADAKGPNIKAVRLRTRTWQSTSHGYKLARAVCEVDDWSESRVLEGIAWHRVSRLLLHTDCCKCWLFACRSLQTRVGKRWQSLTRAAGACAPCTRGRVAPPQPLDTSDHDGGR